MHDRHDVTDAEWARLEPLLPDRTPRRGGRWCDHRQMINGVLWRTRTGAPWRDLPSSYGNWKGVYSRHRRWSGDGTWELILERLRTGCVVYVGTKKTNKNNTNKNQTQQHTTNTQHEPPKDIPAERLAPMLPPVPKPDPQPDPEVSAQPEGHTGGWVE